MKKTNCSLYETFSPDVGCVRCARDFYFSNDLYQIASPTMATAILPPFTDGTVKSCTVLPTATTSWSITGTSATACTRFTRKFEKTVEKVHICWRVFIYQLTQTIRLGGNYEEINGVGI